MDVGIGLPNTIVGTSGSQLLDWSRRAERSGFSSLATIGALPYPSYEELTAFAPPPPSRNGSGSSPMC